MTRGQIILSHRVSDSLSEETINEKIGFQIFSLLDNLCPSRMLINLSSNTVLFQPELLCMDSINIITIKYEESQDL